ncbi:MAG: hypothetical protein WC679_13400 [Bacteroidales bacterium]|jgi:hypothetical protein
MKSMIEEYLEKCNKVEHNFGNDSTITKAKETPDKKFINANSQNGTLTENREAPDVYIFSKRI